MVSKCLRGKRMIQAVRTVPIAPVKFGLRLLSVDGPTMASESFAKRSDVTVLKVALEDATCTFATVVFVAK